MNELALNILTPQTLVSQDEGLVVLDLLCNVYPELMPERYGLYEPLRARFDPRDPKPILDVWGRAIYWAGGKLKIEGCVAPAWAKHVVQGWITFTIHRSDRANIDLLIQFLIEASSHLNADFAALHLLTEPDIEFARLTNTGGILNPKAKIYALSVTGHRIKKNLPDLYWATVFGPAYVGHFGRDRLLSAPAPVVKELANGGIYVQLSESPFDLANDYSMVDGVRRAVKEHLNNNSFFDPSFSP